MIRFPFAAVVWILALILRFKRGFEGTLEMLPISVLLCRSVPVPHPCWPSPFLFLSLSSAGKTLCRVVNSGNDTEVHHLFFSRLWTVGRALDDILKTRRRHLRLKAGEETRPLELARVGASCGLPTGGYTSVVVSCQNKKSTQASCCGPKKRGRERINRINIHVSVQHRCPMH